MVNGIEIWIPVKIFSCPQTVLNKWRQTYTFSHRHELGEDQTIFGASGIQLHNAENIINSLYFLSGSNYVD